MRDVHSNVTALPITLNFEIMGGYQLRQWKQDILTLRECYNFKPLNSLEKYMSNIARLILTGILLCLKFGFRPYIGDNVFSQIELFIKPFFIISFILMLSFYSIQTSTSWV